MSRAQYKPDICEFFDLVVSNPPFGITLAAETRAKLSKTFTLPDSTASEGLFVERSFQLLKPGGRLAIVLPESLLNAKEMIDVRLFLYRFFEIRCIVSMPRNIFIDTPTLTSLLFAQKKSRQQIAAWDEAWDKATKKVETRVKAAAACVRIKFAATHDGEEVAEGFLKELSPVLSKDCWVSKGGKSPAIFRMKKDWSKHSGEETAAYYREVLKTANFQELCRSYVFSQMVQHSNSEFPTFVVNEIGYKLSKRKEKDRPNQLCIFQGKHSK